MNTLRKHIEASLSQSELAELVRQPGGHKGVDPSYISSVVSGSRLCPHWLAKEIVRVLNEHGAKVTIKDLFKAADTRWEVKR